MVRQTRSTSRWSARADPAVAGRTRRHRLSVGIEPCGIDRDANGEVVPWMSYRPGTAEWTSEGRGETVVAAHADLRQQLVPDRIRIGIRAMVLDRR